MKAVMMSSQGNVLPLSQIQMCWSGKLTQASLKLRTRWLAADIWYTRAKMHGSALEASSSA